MLPGLFGRLESAFQRSGSQMNVILRLLDLFHTPFFLVFQSLLKMFLFYDLSY